MTERLYIQLSDDTGDELFDAAERISWYIPEQTARFIAREIIMTTHEFSPTAELERTENQVYLWGFLSELLRKSGAAYKYILKPANKEGQAQ